MAADTWSSREARILEAIAEWRDAPLASDELLGRLDLPNAEVQGGFLALRDAGYITARDLSNGTPLFFFDRIRLLEPGRRHIGTWPKEITLAEFVDAIESLIDSGTVDDDSKSRLVRFRDSAVGLGGNVFASIVGNVITKHTGI